MRLTSGSCPTKAPRLTSKLCRLRNTRGPAFFREKNNARPVTQRDRCAPSPWRCRRRWPARCPFVSPYRSGVLSCHESLFCLLPRFSGPIEWLLALSGAHCSNHFFSTGENVLGRLSTSLSVRIFRYQEARGGSHCTDGMHKFKQIVSMVCGHRNRSVAPEWHANLLYLVAYCGSQEPEENSAEQDHAIRQKPYGQQYCEPLPFES